MRSLRAILLSLATAAALPQGALADTSWTRIFDSNSNIIRPSLLLQGDRIWAASALPNGKALGGFGVVGFASSAAQDVSSPTPLAKVATDWTSPSYTESLLPSPAAPGGLQLVWSG